MYVDSLDASPSTEHALQDWDLGIGKALGIDTDKWLEKQKSDAVNNFTNYAESQIDEQLGLLPNSDKGSNAGIGILSMEELTKKAEAEKQRLAIEAKKQIDQAAGLTTTEESKVTEYAKKLNHPATYGVVAFAGSKWLAGFGWITSGIIGAAAAGGKIFYDKSQENKQI